MGSGVIDDSYETGEVTNKDAYTGRTHEEIYQELSDTIEALGETIDELTRQHAMNDLVIQSKQVEVDDLEEQLENRRQWQGLYESLLEHWA